MSPRRDSRSRIETRGARGARRRGAPRALRRGGDELLEELAGAIERGGQRLGRLIVELEELAQETDRLELTLCIPGLPAELRRRLRQEVELATEAFNALRGAAVCVYQQLICQRERCGFCDHELVERCFQIPDLRQPLEISELAAQ